VSKTEDGVKEVQIPKGEAPKHYKVMKLAILNAPILTSAGSFKYHPIDIAEARLMANSMQVESFIGHESTAKVVSQLLQRPVEFSREEFKQKLGQKALVFKLAERQPLGTDLTKEEIEAIGYEFWELYRDV